jgi:hypothetical protein
MRAVRSAAVLVLAVAFALSAGTPLRAQSSSPVSERQAAAFARALVQAMARRDRRAVAAMVRYPATVVAGGLNIPLIDRSTTLEIYNLVFTPELRCLLEQSGAALDGSRPAKYPIRADAGGASFGEGRVRAELVDGSLKVTRIVVPPASGESPPPPAKAQRVAFRWGTGEAQFAGRLYGDGVDSYVLTAAAGALLQARIERFPGRGASLRVVNMATGRALEHPGTPWARIWAARVPEAGDYQVDVVRHASYCEKSFTYLLTLSLR